MNIQEQKRKLRSEMLAKLREVSADDRADAGNFVADRLYKWLASEPNTTYFRDSMGAKVSIALFASLPTEIDTRPLDAMLLKLGARRFLPVWEPEHPDLWFYELQPNQNVSSSQNDVYSLRKTSISYEARVDISEIQLFIIPALAFDRKGGRLGRGKGYYDRLLAQLRLKKPKPLTMAIGLDLQLVNDAPVEAHDERVTHLCTPEYGLIPAAVS